jgi:hypothetical protein
VFHHWGELFDLFLSHELLLLHLLELCLLHLLLHLDLLDLWLLHLLLRSDLLELRLLHLLHQLLGLLLNDLLRYLLLQWLSHVGGVRAGRHRRRRGRAGWQCRGSIGGAYSSDI